MEALSSDSEQLQRPDSGERRDQILDAAERLFAEQGFAATPMRAIAQAADVNVATVYYHCGSKEQLFQSIYARVVERMGALVQSALLEGGPFNAMVARVLDQVVAYFVQHPSIPKLLLRSAVGEVSDADQARRDTYRPLFEMVAAMIQERADKGEIRTVDPARFLDAATGVIFHLAVSDHRREGGKVSSDELASIQAHARLFILGALGLEDGVGSPSVRVAKGKRR
jgi:AcrR family transcriptional regulator